MCQVKIPTGWQASICVFIFSGQISLLKRWLHSVFLHRYQASFKIHLHFGETIEQLKITHNTRLYQVKIRKLKLNLTSIHHLSQALYTNESMAHRILQADKAALETEKEEITAQRDQSNNVLWFITQFSNFPVQSYCTLTKGGRLNLTY